MKLKIYVCLVFLTLFSLIMKSDANYHWNFTFNSDNPLSNRRHLIRVAPQLYYCEEKWNLPDNSTLKLINNDKLLVFRMNTGYGEYNVSCGTFEFTVHFMAQWLFRLEFFNDVPDFLPKNFTGVFKLIFYPLQLNADPDYNWQILEVGGPSQLEISKEDRFLLKIKIKLDDEEGEYSIVIATEYDKRRRIRFIVTDVSQVKRAFQFHHEIERKDPSKSFITKYVLLSIGSGIILIFFILNILINAKSKEPHNNTMEMTQMNYKINNCNNFSCYKRHHNMRNSNVMDTNNDACNGQSCSCQAAFEPPGCNDTCCQDACSLPECEDKKGKKKKKRLQKQYEKKVAFSENKRKKQFDRQQFNSYYGFSGRTNGLGDPVMFEDNRPCDPESEYLNRALFNEPCYRVGCPLHYSKFRCFYCINEAITFIVNNQQNEEEEDEDDSDDGGGGDDECCQDDCCDCDPCECQCKSKRKLKGSADVPIRFSNPPTARIVPMNTPLETAPPHGILKKQKNPTVEKGNEFLKATHNKQHPVDKERHPNGQKGNKGPRNTQNGKNKINKENADMYDAAPPEEEKESGLQKIDCQKRRCCNKCNNRKKVKKAPKKTNMRQYVTIKLCTACKPDDLKCVNKRECDVPIPMMLCPEENCEDWGGYDNFDTFEDFDNQNCPEYQ